MDIERRGEKEEYTYTEPTLKRYREQTFTKAYTLLLYTQAYTASKGAVLAMSRELAIVHARENIRVNSLCP